MASILDSILEGARVVSEQHDVRLATLGSDPTEMRGKMGIDTSTGRASMFSVGEVPWHGLGVVIDRLASSAEAIRFANLGWSVELTPAMYEYHGAWLDSGNKVVVRQDTGKALSVVGNRYVPLQNQEAFDFLDGVIGEYGAQYETAGALDGGKKIWLLAHMPELTFDVVPGDTIEPYVLFSNSHDGTSSIRCLPTSIRVVCANTLRRAHGKGRGQGVAIRHTKSARGKIAAAREALGFASHEIEEFRGLTSRLVQQPVENPRHYFEDVLDAVLDVTALEARTGAEALAAALDLNRTETELAAKSFDRKIRNRGEVLSDILERYSSDRCQPSGTAWAAWNAVTEHADHGSARYKGSEQERRENRFESILMGRADEIKATALDLVMQVGQ